MYWSPGEKACLLNLLALYLATCTPLKTTGVVGVYLVFGVQRETGTLNLGCLPPSGLTLQQIVHSLLSGHCVVSLTPFREVAAGSRPGLPRTGFLLASKQTLARCPRG